MKTITHDELKRLSFCNSKKLPKAINDNGVRREWVGVGWVDCGPANGTEVKVVDKLKGKAPYKCAIPPGRVGDWEVVKFKLTASEIARYGLYHRKEAERTGSKNRMPVPGSYTKLVKTVGMKDTIMSDTPAELDDLSPLVRNAKGRILIHGLGLGIAAELCLLKSEVEHVTVVEKSQDVLDLVAPTLEERWGDRLAIMFGDAFEWRPRRRGARYDAVWSDIWDAICADNLVGMKKLRRTWAKRCGWHGCWAELQCIRLSAYW